MQWRFSSFVVINLRPDLHRQECAHAGRTTQPRINDLLRGRVSRFSLDALVNIATAIDRRVHLELEAA